MSKPSFNKVPVSVVVLTKNEEGRLRACLDSVAGWVDEIVVVDDESADRTVDIAREYTERVFSHKTDVHGRQRNWADSQARNAWVLSLDADERVTQELKEEIINLLENGVLVNGYTIPRKNYIGDYWVRHGGWYPSAQLKLFRKDMFQWEEVDVHCRAFLKGNCGHLKGDILHYSYRNMEDFFAKLNRQTSSEARKWFNQGKPMRLGRFLWRAIDRFCRSYFWKGGFKDGYMGFIVAYFAALYQFISYLKYCELAQRKEKELIHNTSFQNQD